MRRFLGIAAIYAFVLAGMSVHAMPLGVRTMMHARAAVRQSSSAQPPQMWTVSFVAQGGVFDGGSVEADPISVMNGYEVGALPAITRPGYLFKGWWTAASGGNRVTSLTVVKGDTIVYAHWAAAWTVTLNANGGTVDLAKVLVMKGKTVGALPVPTLAGYSFAGWWTKKSGGTKITAKTKVTKNVTYYAHWTAKKYSVKVVKEGNGSVSGAGSKAYKSKVTLKAKAASGYVFQGWYDVNEKWRMENGELPNGGLGKLVSLKATYSFKVPIGGVTYKAKFITKAEDKAAIGMEFEGVGFGALEDGGLAGRETLPIMTNMCGVVTTWPVATTGATPVSVSVKGQPKGMKYDTKKKAVTGVPSVAGKSGTMTITVKSSGASRAWKVKWRTVEMPLFARGTFNGWTHEEWRMENEEWRIGDEEWRIGDAVRKVTVGVTGAGKITAKVGSLSLTRTGWIVGEDGKYRATLTKTRTVGSGKKAKKYKDVMTLTLDPEKGWMEDQLSGAFGTFGGSVALNDALEALNGALEANGGEDGGHAGRVTLPVNADTGVLARRNPFGDKDNAEAKSVAADLAALGTQDFMDETGLAWKIKVSANGVATISRTTGTGKKKKTISATAVLEVADSGGGDVHATARFPVSGKIVTFAW